MDSEVRTFFIKNELCRRGGLCGKWLPVNQIGVYPYVYVNSKSQDKPSDYAPDSASVFHLRQEVILFEPTLRKLVNESNGIFLNLQKFIASQLPEVKVNLINFSRQYRSVVRACLDSLQIEYMQAESRQMEQLQSYVTVFYSVECIWHLCEILFIENIPGNIVIGHLLEWVRFHFPKYERAATKLLTSDLIGLESEPNYWETVIGCLLQGRIEIVRTLLRLHSSADSDHFILVDHILKSMPTYNVYGGISINEFQLKWKHWMVDTQAKIDAKLFVAEKNLQLIMSLVIGDESSWAEAQNQCETWYELLAAWLFYTEPTVKSYELGDFAKRCISRMHRTNSLKHLDRVLVAAMEADILQVVNEIQEMTDNGWFVTHLTDLLYHAEELDVLDKTEPEEMPSNKLRESFLLDYGSMLMGHHSLWQVGISYLDYCPMYGIATMELLLMRLPLHNESRTMKIIKEAQKRQLAEIVHNICKIQTAISVQHGRLGNALMWSIKSQDSLLISHIADKYLREFISTGVMQNADILDNLGHGMLTSDRLIFLGKYREFQKHFEAGENKIAASLFVPLISSKITPKFFWSTLLSNALPLLNNDELLLSSNDTFTILQCLEEKVDCLKAEDMLKDLRLAVANNLGRCLIHEAQLQ